MSTIKDRLTKRERISYIKLVMCGLVLIFMVMFSADMVSYAEETPAGVDDILATTTDAGVNGVVLDSDGYFRYYENDQVQTAPGWRRISDTEMIYIDQEGHVTSTFSRNGDVININEYNVSTKGWDLVRNRWISIDNGRYYMDSTGICSKLYYTDSQKAYRFAGNSFSLADNREVVLNDGRTYYFNSKGIRVSKAGWYTTFSGTEVNVGSNGAVYTRIYKDSGIYRISVFDSSSKEWVQKANLWKKSGSKLYYFSDAGEGITVYNLSTKKLYIYSYDSDNYVLASNTVSKLNEKYYYYYNKSGVRVTSEGWQTLNSKVSYYVGSKGYITLKYTNKSGVRKLYSYNYSTNKWTLRKNLWKNVSGSKIYFNTKGIATIYYNTKTKGGFTYSSKKWKPIKKTIKKIAGTNVYFNGSGKRVTKKGVYKTSDGYLAYVNSRGNVYKREYDLSVKRYYTIDLGHGKKTKVYGYYDLDGAKKLMKEVNQHRQDNGFSALSANTSMTDTATTRAIEISNTYSHYRPNGTLCINSMYELYGENLACGFENSELVFRAWKKSSAHNSNMLNTSYKTMGAAVFVALKNDKQGYKKYYVLTFGK